VSFSDLDEKGDMDFGDDSTDSKRELEPHTVDPKKGWAFRGVHRVLNINGNPMYLYEVIPFTFIRKI
jgi:hypothetical protein